MNIDKPMVRGMLCAACLGLTVTTTATAASDKPYTTWTAGYDHSEGTYGSTSTTAIDYSFVSMKYVDPKSDWRIKLTVPWLTISGDGALVDGSGNVISTGGSGTTTEVSGLGDVVLGITYQFPTAGNSMFDGTLKIKAPTADPDMGLGTGKTDYIYQLDYAYGGQCFMPFITAGYKQFGQPDGYTLEPVWFGSAGAQFTLGPAASMGVSWNYQEPSTIGGVEKRDTMGYLNFKLGKQWSAMVYAVKGETESSVDDEAGITLLVKM